MSSSFETDPYPGRPRILFVGYAESTHTHSWVDLLEGAAFNVRLFALPSGSPPAGWWARTYVTAYYSDVPDSETRARLFPRSRVARFAQRNVERVLGLPGTDEAVSKWLAKIVGRWRPDIVHTLGLDPAGNFYFKARRAHGLGGVGKWVLQTRGGSDLALPHLDPARREEIGQVLRDCDQLLSDNRVNFRIAREMGVREDQLSRIGTVPGTGGIDVEAMARRWQGRPSARRLVLWPKAYETPWGKVLPVFEALKLCWEQIQPCEVEMLSTDRETREWYWALPEHIRRSCRVSERVPRERALELMTEARVMLAPSLVDGTPNSMFEAMAAGALPVVSPLDTIRPVVADEENVLFARNLYPHEIAAALARAMNDDALVEAAAERNLALVRRIADRAEIRERVIGFYESLAAAGSGRLGVGA